MANILVTGGAGYLGVHVVRQLLQNNHRVVVVDHFSTLKKREALPLEVIAVKGDVGDASLLAKTLVDNKIDIVVHMAASIKVGESMEKPIPYLENNTTNTDILIKTMLSVGVNKLIFSSTATVYGYQDIVPIYENASVNPISPYGYSKLAAEQLINFYNRYSGLDAIIFRYFNACGSDFDKVIYPVHETHLIANIMDVVHGKQPELVIYGGDYPTPDGTCIRDYVHVLDIARAHVIGIDYFERRHPHVSLFNVGTGSGYSNLEVVKAAREVTGHPIPVKIGPRRPGDIPISVADTNKIIRELHFGVQHSDLKTILETSWH
jgi:UDP-glucose 4-epimerase